MLETEADRQSALKELGQIVTINDRDVPAIYDDEYFLEMDSPGRSSSSPTVMITTIDAKGVERDAEVIIDDKSFRVREVQPDGSGMTMMELRSSG